MSLSWVYFVIFMMTSSNGNIFCVTGPLCGEFTGPGEFPTQRPVTRSFDVFFDVRVIKRLSKHSRGWWFETLSHPLWRHRNVFLRFYTMDHGILLQKWNDMVFKLFPWIGLIIIYVIFYEYVNYNNVKSDKGKMKCAVAQWSVLCPLLFWLYIDNLTRGSTTISFVY